MILWENFAHSILNLLNCSLKMRFMSAALQGPPCVVRVQPDHFPLSSQVCLIMFLVTIEVKESENEKGFSLH